MTIDNIVIIRSAHGPDYVSMMTDMPSATYPFTAPLDLSFKAAAGTSEAYVAKHFPGIPVQVYERV